IPTRFACIVSDGCGVDPILYLAHGRGMLRRRCRSPRVDMSEPEAEVTEPRFLVPLPGGRVARVPLEVLERYVAEGAKTQHGAAATRKSETTTVRAGASTITINVYAATGEVSVERPDDDVVAHSLS